MPLAPVGTANQERIMHFHTEVIMPPTDDIESSIASIMQPFDENAEESEDHSSRYAFWDFYVIGGRWAGTKKMASYDKEKIEAFNQWLRDEKMTVSGLQWGKQSLSPESQIPVVDQKWGEMFDTGEPCPIFNHSNDQLGVRDESRLDGDICLLKDLPDDIECCRVIIAGPSYSDGSRTGPPEAVYMTSEDSWNGVSHVKSDWDGNVSTVLSEWADKLGSYADGYREVVTPQADWLVVTVDYHT